MIGAKEVAALVGSFNAEGDGEAEKSRELILMLLEHSPQAFSRDCFTPGHITCTGAVLSPDRTSVLLIHHRRLDRWLLPGGHVEETDQRIWDAARREVLEETGVVTVAGGAPLLAGMDVHAIPPKRNEPLHLHHDLIFAFQAVADECIGSEEVREVEWCRLDEYAHYQLPGSIRRAVARAARTGMA